MRWDVEPSGKAGTLKLMDRCTIENVRELKEELTRAMEDAEVVCIDIEGVTEVDLACLQVLCAAHRSSLQGNKKLQLKGAWQQAPKQIINDAGYFRSIGCHKDPGKSCLWTGEF